MAPPSSRPRATAHGRLAAGAPTGSRRRRHADGDDGEHPGHPGGERERGTGVAGQVEPEQVPDELDRVARRSAGHRDGLARLVEHVDAARATSVRTTSKPLRGLRGWGRRRSATLLALFA